jgi:hypothetical protein
MGIAATPISSSPTSTMPKSTRSVSDLTPTPG